MKTVLYGQQSHYSKFEFFLHDFQQKGLVSFIRSHVRKSVTDPLSKLIFDRTIAKTPVHIEGKPYRYASYWYNFTWQNERAIEVAYFHQIISKVPAKKILEVGNVLRHYFALHHLVLDKYEEAAGVINMDILKYKPKKRFDLIVAISTLEHVGWHEKGHDAQKSLRAIKHLRSLLSAKGKLVFSVPLGINPALDKAIHGNAIPLSKRMYLRRRNRWNEWKQCSLKDIQGAQYNFPFPSANALLIGEMKRK